MPYIFLRAFQACFFGLVGFAFPRFLVALGVPLDQWINGAGAAMNQATWFNYESVTWGFTVVFAFTMLAVERRYGLVEWAFASSQPFKLSSGAIERSILLTEEGQMIYTEKVYGNNQLEWMLKIDKWNIEVQDLLKNEFPLNEFYDYRSLPIQSSEQSTILANPVAVDRAAHLERLKKFRLIVGRYLPKNRKINGTR